MVYIGDYRIVINLSRQIKSVIRAECNSLRRSVERRVELEERRRDV
jgi:hypothetical protein